MKSILKWAFALLLSAAVFSCGEDVDEDSRSVQERILKAYINNNYPGTEPTESGIYIVESVPGEGKAPKDSSCVLVEFTISYLDGSYISYSSADLAKQLGTYSEGKYYGSQIWSVAGSESGIQEILKMMKEGGYIKAVLPPWALGYDTESDIYGTDGSAKIYEITLLEVIDNITAYEDSLLQEYTDLHYPGTDTTSAGFYFIKTKSSESKDTVADEANVNLRYIGKFLDGKVFDTNIADTAKKYGIYTGSDDSYEAVQFKYYENIDDAVSQNSFVTGFSIAAWRLVYGERAIAYFRSDLGYSENGSGNIPGYMPIAFEIWMEELE